MGGTDLSSLKLLVDIGNLTHMTVGELDLDLAHGDERERFFRFRPITER